MTYPFSRRGLLGFSDQALDVLSLHSYVFTRIAPLPGPTRQGRVCVRGEM